jgi:hypothetical protein
MPKQSTHSKATRGACQKGTIMKSKKVDAKDKASTIMTKSVASGVTQPPSTEGPSIERLAALPPVRRARAEALLKWSSDHYVSLTGEYKEFEKWGWDRRGVEQAVDDLASVGLATISCGEVSFLRLILSVDVHKSFKAPPKTLAELKKEVA